MEEQRVIARLAVLNHLIVQTELQHMKVRRRARCGGRIRQI
jgi:hypothetical protein